MHDTFAAVFPHVLSFGDIAIGSNKPIAFDRGHSRRLQDPAVRSHYLRGGVDIEALLAPYLRAPGPQRIEAAAARAGDLNEDLFPRDEFGVRRGERR